MEKILDNEFRQNLYKSLMDAGYDKKEAMKIVGVKYHSALKTDLVSKLTQFVAGIETDNYVDEEGTTNAIREFSSEINELRKIKGVINED